MTRLAWYRNDEIYISDTTVWTLADEVRRLNPNGHDCPRCGLPTTQDEMNGEICFTCPGVCDYIFYPTRA